MPFKFQESETRRNLMRAFAGESQARNRYTFAASACRAQKLYVLEAVFRFTAGQEQEHAEIFYHHLLPSAGESISVDGDYPVDLSNSAVELLRMAQRNEFHEFDPVYQAFGATAQAEGFPQVAASFLQIALIERGHGDRFGRLADLLEQGKLFAADVKCAWMCLNCGHIQESREAPKLCPVCGHEQGYFIRLEMAPYAGGLLNR